MKTLKLKTKKQVDKYLFQISPVLREQIAHYLDDESRVVSRNDRTMMYRAVRIMYEYNWQFSPKFFQDLRKLGVEAFIQDDGAAWLKFREIDLSLQANLKIRRVAYTKIGSLLSHVLGSPVNISRFNPYAFEFPSLYAIGHFKYVDMSSLKDYPALLNQLKEKHEIELKRTDGEKLHSTTLRSLLQQLQNFLGEHLSRLSKVNKALVAEHGAHAFIMNGHAILKQIRQAIQLDSKADKISLYAGGTYQRALDKLLTFYGLNRIAAYPVSAKKRNKHEEKARETQPLYSFEETVELAYSIEIALNTNTLTELQQMSLLIGRVMLKTAWNVTPLLELEVDDIFTMNSPLDGSESPCVRLFKRRANYDTQWHQYAIPASCLDDEGVLIGKTVRPVISDLKELKYTICASTRNAMPDDHPLKSRLLVTYSSYYNDWIGLTEAIFATLNEALKKVGCETRFNSRRIRKSGLNYIYKKVSKSFNDYKKAGQHSFSVFLKYYLKSNANKSKKALSDALEIMGDYFNDRVLSEDIIILTEVPSNSKQTPNGSCVTEGNDYTSKSYNRKHYRLHKENDTEDTPCADFNACLFCEFYRLVADAEHVWRLLSYRDYVLSQMRNSIGEYDNQAQQQVYAQTLEQRVDEILNKIAKLNANAIPEGEALLSENGVHQDWEIVA